MRKINFKTIKFIAFIIYNLAYVLYMTNYVHRNVYLILMLFFIVLCFIEYSKKKQWVLFSKTSKFNSEYKKSLFIAFSFLMISTIFQIINAKFGFYTLEKLLYLVIPPTLAYLWINTTDDESRYKYFLVYFLRVGLYFILFSKDNFTIYNILNISWNDSKSSVFESTMAHDLFFLEIIFLYLKKEKLALISCLLCMLSFKRISFIFSFFSIIIYFIFKKRKKFNAFWKTKSPNLGITRGIILLTLILPYVIQWVTSNNGILFFDSIGINIEDFSTGRVGLITMVRNNMDILNGFGSIDQYFLNSPNAFLQHLGSMHCDILSIFYETGIIGLFIYIYNMIKISQKKWIVFYLFLYLWLELIFSHFLDSLGVWTIFYMFAAYVYDKGSDENEKNWNNNRSI